MNCYFFGTFNPIHLGHLEIARQVKEKMNFDRIIFVPSFMPPHKVDDLESFSHRFNMVKLAVDEDVSDIERKLSVPSYTYRTIEKLFDKQDGKKVNFIIGYDQFFKLESWKNPEVLKEKIHFIVIPRRFQNGQTLASGAFDYFRNKGFVFSVLDIKFLDVSSSMIRKFIAENNDITGLTTGKVKKYIENNRLYINKTAEKKLMS